MEVEERLGEDGEIIIPIEKDSVIEAARRDSSRAPTTSPSAFSHAYRHDRHERQAKAWIAEEFPDVYVITLRSYGRSSANMSAAW